MAEYTIGKDLDLKKEQEKTLETPYRKSNIILKIFYLTADIMYGFKRSLPKFRIIEIMARYPYWAWENGGYHKLTKLYSTTKKVSEEATNYLKHLIELGREAQDNEELHMLILTDIIHQKGIKLGWFKHYFLPRFLAFGYYYMTKILYFINPKWSFSMNASFESHAEHEYMKLSKEHPEWDEEDYDSIYFKLYPKQKNLGDLIRRIGLDERDHMNQSIEEIEKLNEIKNKKCS